MSTKTKEAARPKPASSKAKAATASSGAAKHKKRLRPGELDGLVLSYMCKHEGELPLTASAIGPRTARSKARPCRQPVSRASSSPAR
jgi:hypothetical protein